MIVAGIGWFLGFIGFGIMLDLILGGGDAIKQIIHGNGRQSTEDLIESLLNELDNLYDELTYENTHEDEQCIRAKITIREKVVDRLLNDK